MSYVPTPYGPGRIVAQDTVRGRTSYKVAGEGFEVWVDGSEIAGYRDASVHTGWAPMDDDNSTDLPYDPSPQHEAIGTPGDDGSSTIQPIHHIDADERLSPSDSVSFDDREGDPEPGPSRELFAARLRESGMAPAVIRQLVIRKFPHQYDHLRDLTEKGINTVMPGQGTAIVRGAEGAMDASNVNGPINHVDRSVDQALNALDPGGSWNGIIHDASRREGSPAALAVPLLRTLAPMAIGQGLGAGADAVGDAVDSVGEEGDWGGLVHDASRADDLRMYQDVFGGRPDPLSSAGDAHGPHWAPGYTPDPEDVEARRRLEDPESGGLAPGESWGGPGNYWDAAPSQAYYSSYRPAGLSDKYIDITAGADYHNDPIAQFRHDPDAYINRIGHLMDEGLNPRFAEYMDLVEGDASIRTAAWKDVRKKAMRLRREGAIHVEDIDYDRIYASVQGDHGTYDVMIKKGGAFGGFGGGHAISNWHCSCDWGKWAFRRRFTYVGRLCSHGYACYMEMQSNHMKGKKRQTKLPRPHRYKKRADNLQNGPQRLVPDMVVNDTDDDQMFLDVTTDERKDVGPDDVVSEKDIVHFARLLRHYEVLNQPYPREVVAALARYADCNDGSDDTQSDYEAADATDANEYLDTLRSDADRDQEDDFGSMAERVRKIQDTVEEAREHGADASRFVAAVRKMADGNDYTNTYDTINKTVPNAVRNDPNSPGASILWRTPDNQNPELPRDANGIPHRPTNPDPIPGGGGAYAQSDRRGKPRPGTSVDPALSQATPPAAAPKPASPGNGTPANGGQATPAVPAAPAAPGNNGQATPATLTSGPGGAGGYQAPGGGQTSGTIADGGVAGAENGNNSAITKNMLDADGNYTVGAGDTWSDIAQRTTGDMNNYQKMYDAQGGKAGGNIDSLAEGTKINLKDFANDVGNNGVSGDVTNPAGGGADKDIATPDAGPAMKTPDVNTSAIGGAGEGTNANPAVTPPAAAETPAQQPAQQPASDTGKKARLRRRAADGDTNQTAPTTDSAAPESSSRSTTDAGAVTPAPGSPSKSGDTFDPASPVEQEQQSLNAANPGAQAGNSNTGLPDLGVAGGGMAGMGDIGGLIGQGVGAATDIASGIGQALPGIASGIGSIFASRQDFDDFLRYAYPTGAGDDDDPKSLPHIPFAGSGNPGHLDIGTSWEYADKARKKMDDVTDLGDGDLTKPMGKWQRQSALDDGDDPYREASFASTDDDSDIVRTFQAHLGDTALGAGAGRGAGRFDDIAGAAQGFLRTAGRNYSLAEQSELIREGDKGGARNLDSLQLEGTHYEDMNTLGW